MKALDRRQFLKAMGGGLVVFFSTEMPVDAQSRRSPSRSAPPSSDFNAFLQIKEDGRVACFTGKVELGQGIVTSLAQMLAEELDVSIDSVDMVMGDTDLCPYDAGTYGSRTTKYFGPLLREAGAQARAILLEMAASRLDVPPARLTISEGVIQDPRNPGKKISYADLVRGSRIEKKVEAKAELKSPSYFKVSGKPMARMDGFSKVTGQAQYAGDIRLPDMLYARILRPPAHGSVLKSVDTSAAEKFPGLKIIREGNLLAVLHPLPDQAEKGLALIKAQFTTPPIEVDEKTLFAHLLKVAPGGSVISQEGSLEKGEQSSSRRFEENYFQHYVAHAPMETHTALAHAEGKKATVWASTQTPFGVKDSVARALSLSSEDVRVITPFVGGGFGGKTWNQQAVEAALLAKRAGKPVQVAWTREEEFFYDAFMAAAAEVEVDPQKGDLQVRRLVCAQDMGQVINPEGARMQIEGCLMMGLGYALSEEIRFRGGEILDRNFDTYRIPLFSGMPKIETVLVENRELTPQGGGEPAITCMGAVLANALYDAVGVRVFELPMTPERIRKAMAQTPSKSPRSPL